MDSNRPHRIDDPKQLRSLEAGHSSSLRVTLQVPFDRAPDVLHASALALRAAIDHAEQQLVARAGSEDLARERMARVAHLPDALSELDRHTRAIVLFGNEDGWAWSWPTLPLASRVTVAPHFAVRPLLRAFQTDVPFRVLAVSANRVVAYDGDARGLRLLDTPELPHSLESALGHELERGSISYRSEHPVPGRARSAPIFHGHGGASSERELDRERFHRALAEALEKSWGELTIPIVLAADVGTAGSLRPLVERPSLLEGEVHGSPEDWSLDELHERARAHVLDATRHERERRLEGFERARNQGKVRTELSDAVAEAIAGRVACLWVEEDAHIAGRVDQASARVTSPESEDDDVLDALTSIVLRRAGDVRVVPSGDVPGSQTFAVELR